MAPQRRPLFDIVEQTAAGYSAACAAAEAGMRSVRGRSFWPVAARSAGGNTSRLGHSPVTSVRA